MKGKQPGKTSNLIRRRAHALSYPGGGDRHSWRNGTAIPMVVPTAAGHKWIREP